GIFLVWCADLYRNQHAVETVQGGQMEVDLLEPFVVATIDVALAAQNAIVAAESMGLGGVFIGGIRNQPAEVTALLELPKLVFPAFGMCLGVPAQTPGVRPRLPVSGVLHYDRYEVENIHEGIRLYDEIMEDYYRKRGRETVANWSLEQKRRFSLRIRADLKAFLEQQGFHFK
ncbi:MAG: nitroreductase, partial [Bacilli bacterium]|nr:nitroreductase [Bacilli bacterium]